MPAKQLCISADSHVVESVEFFAPLVKRFGDQAPRVVVTFEDDPIGIRTRDFIGTNTLLWGNDYPHGDSVFPHSQQVLSEVLQDCTPEERYEMTVKNVVQLYNLPFEV